ncbi:MAG: translation initiation factor IF-2 [Hespellia sp.]|nr:translation initiation factor IF-2 [Hespellia sp.]
MTKLRVHELAKELKMENKQLIKILEGKGVEVKSHMSSLTDEQIAMVKAPKSEAPKSEEPKKKHIVQVFRPQNSKNGGRSTQRPQGQNASQGQRPQGQGTQQRPQGQGAAQGQRPQGQSSATQGQRPQSQGNQQGQSAQGNRPAGSEDRRPNQGQRTYNNGERRPYNNTNNNGERRPYNNTNNSGERRPYNNTNNSGERRPYNNTNNNGERRPYNNTNNNGERRPYNNTNNNGERRPYNNTNSNGERRPYNNTNNNGERRPYNNTNNNGERRPYNNTNNNGERRPYNNNNSNGERRPYNNNNGERRPYNNSNGQGGRGQGRPAEKSSTASVVMEQKPTRAKPHDRDKDHKKKDYRKEEFAKGPKGKKGKPVVEVKKPQPKEEKKVEVIKQIILPEVLTIKELADKMKIVPSVIVKKLFLQGKVVTLNQEIDYEAAEEIAMEFEVLCEPEVVVDVIEELLKEDEEDESKMVKRPPVVCVMGHVDHGKTSLLDAIRDTNVTDREAGGITQHIGASVVDVNGEKITFLDTPGHEAFTAMRMRGASSTDIAILVVAADDGVMPQTIEAINHAKAAGIEIVVAVNKIDKPSANIERVKQELTEYELIPEDWGGSTIFVPVSAHTKEGIPELMDMLILTAEVMELKANPERNARGLVIEAELDKGKGAVATVLVQKGTLHVGDAIAAGSAHGKVRAMMDDKGRRVKEAGPSMPVEILGLNEVPNAGEVFVGCDNDKEARSFAETFISQGRVNLLADTKSKNMSLDDLFSQIKEGNLKELGIVVKADVQGSVEAIKQSLLKLSNDEVVIKIIHGGVGAINESDVMLASASNAIIIGFNVRPDVTAKEIAEREKVDLRLYRVIYQAIEDVEAAMKGMLDPVFEEKVLGHAEVRQTFKASGIGTIAGSYVLDGVFERGCSVRLTRDNIVIFDGPLASLKRFKDDVKEVKSGYECGFVFENYNDIQEGDLVEAYKMVEVER